MIRLVGTVLAFVVGVAAPAWGQSTGVIEGVVRDKDSDAVIGDATVRVLGTPLIRRSDPDGKFAIAGIEPGAYSVMIAVVGYTPVTLEVQVVSGGRTLLEAWLVPNPLELPGVVVTASRGVEAFGKSTASVAVISANDIERLSVTSIDGALRFASGVTFNGEQMDIRGASGVSRGIGGRVLMMLDGTRFLQGTTGEISFSSLPIVGIERIEIVKGPSSAQYGSNALGGVVNVISKPIPQHPETFARLHFGIYDSPGQYAFTNETLSYQGLDVRHARRLGRVGVAVEAGRKVSDGYQQNGGFDRWFLKTDVEVARDAGPPIADFFAVIVVEDDEQHFSWRSRERRLEVPPEAVGDWLRSKELIFGGTVTPIVSQAAILELRPSVYYASVQHHFRDNQDYHRSTRLGIDGVVSLFPSSGHGLQVGAEAAVTPISSSLLGSPSVRDLAAFVHDDWDIGRQWRATVGVRIDYHDTDLGESELTVNPKVGVVFVPWDQLSLRASVSRGYRAPTALEQFISATVGGFKVVPNPGLRGESSWAFEVGTAARLGGWGWLDVGLFHSEFDDLIEPALASTGLFEFQFRNVAEARIRGADVSFRAQLAEFAGFRASYLFLDTKDKRTGEVLPYRSKHNASVSLDAWFVGVDLQHRTRVERVIQFPTDPREPITLVDLRFAYRISGFDLQAKVSNLFQETYVDIQEKNLGPSRSFQLMVMRGF